MRNTFKIFRLRRYIIIIIIGVSIIEQFVIIFLKPLFYARDVIVSSYTLSKNLQLKEY